MCRRVRIATTSSPKNERPAGTTVETRSKSPRANLNPSLRPFFSLSARGVLIEGFAHLSRRKEVTGVNLIGVWRESCESS